MTAHYLDLLVTAAVAEAQEAHGSHDSYAWMIERAGSEPDRLGPKEMLFLTTRDSFYLASVSASGWPYVQHRGGPPGFLKVLDDRTLGFADYRGNRQYLSLGNVATDDRVSIFAIDYVRRARLKLLGRMRAVGIPPGSELAAALADPDYKAVVERGFLIEVEAFDWNCPQHITPRYTMAEVGELLAALQQRIAALEAENAAFKAH